MYYSNFPAAPCSVVSGISAVCVIPSIVDARVGKDGSLFLDVYQDVNWRLTAQVLEDLADFCEVDPSDIEVGPHEDKILTSVVVTGSAFDFTEQYAQQGSAVDDLISNLEAFQVKLRQAIRDADEQAARGE